MGVDAPGAVLGPVCRGVDAPRAVLEPVCRGVEAPRAVRGPVRQGQVRRWASATVPVADHTGFMQRWLWLMPLLGAGWAAFEFVTDGALVPAALVLLVGMALAWYLLPWRGAGGIRHAEVMTSDLASSGVVIYWRPGCGYCARLRSALGPAKSEATWINIWQDDEAAAFVRSVNEGSETVPTVVIDGTPHTNPDPKLVLERLTKP